MHNNYVVTLKLNNIQNKLEENCYNAQIFYINF